MQGGMQNVDFFGCDNCSGFGYYYSIVNSLLTIKKKSSN